MRFPIVAPLEQFAADSALMCGFLRCSPLALLFDSVHTGQDGGAVESRLGLFANHIVEFNWVRRMAGLGPITGLASVKVLRGVGYGRTFV